MSKPFGKELFTLAQFSALALPASPWAFAATSLRAEPGVRVNVSEAWRNAEPFVGQLPAAFLALGGARLALVPAASRLRHPPSKATG